MLLVRCPFSPRLPSRRLFLNPPGVRRVPTACLRSSPSSPHLPSESTTDSPSPSLSTTTTTQATGDLFLDAKKHGEDRLSYQLSSDNGVSSVIPAAESTVEKLIFDFRFLALLAIGGSLGGSLLCFLNGCVYVVEAYKVYWTACIKGIHTGQMVLRLVEAIDVYLAGTVMLIFAMGLYGLFISNSPPGVISSLDRALKGSSLFGMFTMKVRPKWMQIDSLDELKTKVGHVIVMILLVKMFERSKMVAIVTTMDLLSYSVCIFLSSASLYILHHLHKPE